MFLSAKYFVASSIKTKHSVRDLSIALEDIEVGLSECDLSNQQDLDLEQILDSVRGILEKLEGRLEKYAPPRGSTGSSAAQRTEQVRKKTRWDSEDIRRLQARIVSNTSFLNAFQITISG